MSLIRRIVNLVINLILVYILTTIFYIYINRQYAFIFYFYSLLVMIGIYFLGKNRLSYIKVMSLTLLMLSMLRYVMIFFISLPIIITIIRYDDVKIYVKSFLRRIKNG